MPNESQYEREEQQLDDDLSSGRITSAEYTKQLRELQRDYRAAAEESAQGAYDRELGNW